MADEVVRLGSDELGVEVVPALGARVHRIVAFGHDVVRTAPSIDALRADPIAWGGYLMAPWCNRAPAGPTRVGSTVIDLAPSFADGTAIHGLVHDRPWRPDGDGAWRIDVPAGGWPWAFSVRVRYEVTGPVFTLALGVENGDDTPMPAGVGWHPWFVDPVELTIPAATVFESNIGSGAAVAVHGRFDRRAQGPLEMGVDATWTELDPTVVTLDWPTLGVAADLDADHAGYVAAAAIPGLDAVAVEPQTHAPDGVRRLRDGEPGALTWLQPGNTLEIAIRLAFRRR